MAYSQMSATRCSGSSGRCFRGKSCSLAQRGQVTALRSSVGADLRWAACHPPGNGTDLSCPETAHQLCHFHYLREAAKPIYEADRHAKKELKKQVRGIRPIEASLEEQSDQESEVVRDYCLAVRSALTDDGHPPLAASGLKLYDRLSQIVASIARVAEKR